MVVAKCFGSVAFSLALHLIVIPLCHAERNFSESGVIYGRWKRQSCRPSQFQCKSGECIASFQMCDGEAHCQDQSDETEETCLNKISCPSYAFKCKYGACVDAESKCNGKRDCIDGSDEDCTSMATTEGPTGCRDRQFQCDSGICIDQFLLCDGTKDCDDGSDETAKACGTFNCPIFVFRCDYGACIDSSGLCNGIEQCADGSDESPLRCGTTTTTTTTTPRTPPPQQRCKLPEQPQNGAYTLGGCDPPSCTIPSPGTEVSSGLLIYTCNPGFHITGSGFVICKGDWMPSLPTCERASCPPLKDQSRDIRCMLEEKTLDCDKPMAPGTQASARCTTFFTSTPEYLISDATCLQSGNWSRPIYSCTPVCGLPNPKGLPFVSHGTETKLGEYPWHAGIFRLDASGQNAEQWCGGTIISPRAIVTAAHCFWDIARSVVLNTNEFRIVVGKYYREWQRTTRYEERLEIDKLIMHDQFRGNSRLYQDDIAVVILKTEMKISTAIQPICIDYNKQFLDYFVPGKAGTVMGWGLTENNTKSDILITATLPFVEFAVCEKSVPETFLQYLSRDKFCAGYRNGTSVCRGDSGGGFSTQFRDGRYYLLGIVSVGIQAENPEECNNYQYTTFTKVYEYYDFIKKSLIT